MNSHSVSKLLNFCEAFRVLDALHNLFSVFDVCMIILHSGIENIGQAFNSHKMIGKYPNTLFKLVFLLVLPPHLPQVVNGVYFWLETFHNHHELQKVYLKFQKYLFDLSAVFLNIGKHSLAVIFRNVLCVVPQRRIVGNSILLFFYCSASPKSYHFDILVFVRYWFVFLPLKPNFLWILSFLPVLFFFSTILVKNVQITILRHSKLGLV